MNIGTLLTKNPPGVKNFSKAVPVLCADPALIYGVELEIESAQGQDWVVAGMHGKEDGSLRDGGYEYITQPMSFSNLQYCLTQFFAKSRVTDDNYSERCSVHVHTNVHDLTVDQLSSVLLLYQLFEKLLFRFIGNDRDKNIFCVPWSETTLNYNIINKIKMGLGHVKLWQKYTAVNLLPMLTQCSIEFRHMAGTKDKDFILLWCNLIGCLFAYARKTSVEEIQKDIMALNTNSMYRAFLLSVFREWSASVMKEGFETDLEDGVLQMKYSLINKDQKQDSKKSLYEMVMEGNHPEFHEDEEPFRPLTADEFADQLRGARAPAPRARPQAIPRPANQTGRWNEPLVWTFAEQEAQIAPAAVPVRG